MLHFDANFSHCVNTLSDIFYKTLIAKSSFMSTDTCFFTYHIEYFCQIFAQSIFLVLSRQCLGHGIHKSYHPFMSVDNHSVAHTSECCSKPPLTLS